MGAIYPNLMHRQEHNNLTSVLDNALLSVENTTLPLFRWYLTFTT